MDAEGKKTYRIFTEEKPGQPRGKVTGEPSRESVTAMTLEVYKTAVDTQISSVRGRFLETVARNRGFNFRIFPDEEEA